MNLLFVLRSIPLFSCLVTLTTGCHSKEAPATNEPAPVTDTRILVKAAYDAVDLNVFRLNMNTKRASMIKGQLEQEQDPTKRVNLAELYGTELLKAGKTDDAIKIYETVDTYMKENHLKLDLPSKRNMYSLMGIAYMRKGEVENCVQNHNHQSCFIPIAGGGVHQLQDGSRRAISLYEEALQDFPNDLEMKYLLNIAYMTVGEYPGKVPAKFRIDPAWFKNKIVIQPFKDIAPQLGVNHKSLAGGVIVDDFNNDGWLDLVSSSWSPDEELVFYINNGDGTFSDQTKAYGLDGQKGSLNIKQTDFNNDGWLDIYMIRGGWYLNQGDIPNTLLMNTGKGSFEDVTIKAGLTHYAACLSATWADFNLDGWLDLVVANESFPGYERGIDLYINQKDGTFKNEAANNGLTLNEFLKGVVATDVNNDRYPDLYISGLTDGNHLFINKMAEGQGFQLMKDVVRNPKSSFPCWNFDFDNDGNEDLFVSAFSNETDLVQYWMKSNMGHPDTNYLPKLYKNTGNLKFEDVGQSMGLNEDVFTMGCNFGDINTDGFLDFYLATGNPLYQSLVPNKMYLNVDGKRFEDVSYSGGFANIQKGHGVGFGDIDHDGDEDIYVKMGGGYDGDGFYNCLFENPNEHHYNWIVLKLTGKTANRPAIGARVALSVQENGKERKIYRTVTSGASFGANSLALEVGLRRATSINNVVVQWPCKNCPDQTYSGLDVNHAYLLTQDQPDPAVMEYVKVAMMENMDHMQHEHQ